MAEVPSLATQGLDIGAEIYYRADFRDVLEAHLPFLLKDTKNTVVDIEPALAVKNEGHFFDLLTDLSQPLTMHWIIMRLNGYYSPEEFQSTTTSILVPSVNTINNIAAIHTTIHRIR